MLITRKAGSEPPSLVRKSLEDVYFQDELINDELVDRYFEMLLRTGNRQAFIDRVREIMSIDTDQISQIETPTMILWGAEDTWIPVENAQLFSEALPNDTLIIFEKLGHVPMEEAPELTLRPVMDFIQ